jgi:DNA-binding NtrC family response regulator
MSSTRFTVLCVDDEDLQLEARKLLFEDEGFHFIGARKSAEALELFRSREIHAVVLDYWMSGKNGLVLAEEMKRERPDTPIIMLSGFVSLPGEGVGVVDTWLQKSRVRPDVLVEKVKSLINRNRAKAIE